jgi:hypothetical protein
MEELSPEALEQLRRKNLAELQQAAVAKREELAWRQVFRERNALDERGGWYEKWELSTEFMWVPVNPYEKMVEFVERTQRGFGVAAQHAICEHCQGQVPLKWGGFGEVGAQIWLHDIPVKTKDGKPTKLPFVDRVLSRFGYARAMSEAEPKPPKTITVPCPASPIVQAFHLMDVPATLPGVNLGAYPAPYGERPLPYGDPEAK